MVPLGDLSGELLSTVEAMQLFDVPEGTFTVWLEGGCLDDARVVIGGQVLWDVAELRRCVAEIVDDDGG